MPARRQALLLVNQHSRSGQADLSEVVRRLQDLGLQLVQIPPESPAHAAELIRRHGNYVDLVIIGGGDGSLNAAAEALVETGRPLGILPMGTANDLARTLAIPADLIQACDIIGRGRLHRIDLGCVNGKYFFNVASLGLSVEVARALSRDLKRHLGIFGYAVSSIRALRAAHPFRAEIRCDGQTYRLKSLQIAVGNGRHYGGGMTVHEDAAIDDGRLDLYSLAPQSVWSLACMYPALRRGQYGKLDSVHVLDGREVEVLTRKAMDINTDGEVTTRTPARFSVKPKALAVLVPESYAPPSVKDMVHVTG